MLDIVSRKIDFSIKGKGTSRIRSMVAEDT